MFEKATEGSRFDRIMIGHHFVIFSVLLRSDANVGAFLPVYHVPPAHSEL